MRYAADFRKMTDAELTQALSDTKEEMFNLRFQWESGQLEDYSRIKQLKKELARLLTVQRERELAVTAIREEGTDA
jgi:large subunit ribosomal protein L29